MKHCLNWKVIGGLAVVGLGIVILEPKLIRAALPLLLLAACPLSMLFMMGGMGKMTGMKGDAHEAQPDQAKKLAGRVLTRDEHLAELALQLSQMQAQQADIAREVARLETASPSVVRESEAVVGAAEGRH
ncbi:MAG: DUF2933 domain-containing protein [Dehalococcoidia bacterium]